MGHRGQAADAERDYRRLRRQLDRTVTGAPDSPALMRILHLLFRPAEVGLAAQLPNILTSLDELSRRLNVAAQPLAEQLTEMAHRGLVIDIEHRGQRYFSLAPLALGFFEFTFMRVRDDIPQAELARLFDEYLGEDRGEGIYHTVFGQQTQIGRTLVHEESLPQDDHCEVLDWERASHVIQTAEGLAVSTCACRHLAEHMGRACPAPQQVCLTLNYAARSVIGAGLAKAVSVEQGMQILQQSKEAGLAQIADNVQRRVAYLCNCCGCCCEMFQALRRLAIRGAVVTSNWLATVDAAACRGCGRCVAACPCGAIETRTAEEPLAGASDFESLAGDSSSDGIAGGSGYTNRSPLTESDRAPPAQRAATPSARVHEPLCVGCGVCGAACRNGAIHMRSRPQKVLAPETVFDRYVHMAIERGKLAELLFDNPSRLSHRAVGRLVALLERSPPVQALLAIRPLRSAFLRRAVRAARRRAGMVAELLE